MVIVDEKFSKMMREQDEFLQKVGITEAEYVYIKEEALKKLKLFDNYIRENLLSYALKTGVMGTNLCPFFHGMFEENEKTYNLIIGYNDSIIGKEDDEELIQIFEKKQIALYKELKREILEQKELEPF